MTSSLPIFPLNTVLFPGGVLPLRIFEQRYLEMTKACLRDGTPFGVCRIREGAEVGAPAVHESIGCSALISGWEMPHLGLFQLRTRGVEVFRVLDSRVGPLGLIEARVERLPETAGEIREEAAGLCRRVLEAIVERVGAEFLPSPLALDEPRWVSYRLSELLPLTAEDKQHLLEERDDGRRLERLVDLLRAG
jgi:hypothetical protein